MSPDRRIDDPYAVLGVAPTATDAEIKAVYRKLARTMHPDLNLGDDTLEARFKAVGAAYDILRDPETRRRYDAGEIDASGAETPPRDFYKRHAGAGGAHRYRPEGGFDDFADIFGAGPAPGRGPFGGTGSDERSFAFRGGDLRYHLDVAFLDAITGASARVETPDGARLDISIPAGVSDGRSLRLKGRGRPGINGGPPGDALVEISVAPHPLFSRKVDDVLLELPISIEEAILGATIETPTPTGRVNLRVPAGSGSGAVLRLKGKGAQRAGKPGDQLLTLKIMPPEGVDEALREAAQAWAGRSPQSPRKDWGGRA